MIEVIRITDRGQITIPASIRKSLNLLEGSKAVIAKIGTKLVVYPAKENDIMSLFGSLKPTDKSINLDTAISKAKKLKAISSANIY